MHHFATILRLTILALMSLTTGGIERNFYSCPAMYMRYSPKHTACRPPNSRCTIYERGVSKEDKDYILNKHNYLRSIVALGFERANNQPTAANMMEMVWDDELAQVAQKHADQCIFAHDCNECRSVEAFFVGQNIATRSRSGHVMPVPNWDSVIQDLYDEVKYFNPKWIKPFRAPKYPMTGHYTQAMWADTWKVGCGYTVHSYSNDPRFQYVELYTCNYGPTGNIQMAEMYRVGRPCSQCPENTCCGKECERLGIRVDYEGLCKTMNKYGPQPGFPNGNILMWCNFREGQPNRDWCSFVVEGAKQWKTRSVTTGTYASIILTEGQRSTMKFTRELDLDYELCFRLVYRKGPHMAGHRSNNQLTGALFNTVADGFYYLNFTSDAMSWTSTELTVLWWGGPSTISLTYSVPRGAPPQYLDIQEIVLREGKCYN